MASNPFVEWLGEVRGDEVVVDEGDIEKEARGNQWSFSVLAEQARSIRVEDVVAFAEELAKARGEWLHRQRVRGMGMYWWHDEQAGQLRFSMVSASHGRLPFGAQVERGGDLAAIVSGWLRWSCQEGIPSSELVDWGTECAVKGVVRVWVREFPGSDVGLG